MNGLILRLAGPLQSWGERSAFMVRDSTDFPTRSGIIGMIAAAEGRPRTAVIDDYAALGFTIRVDRPGRRLVDFHTIGGGLPRELTVPTAKGEHRSEAKATLVSYRHHLADAVFTVAVTGPDDLISRVTAALRDPHWAPYLGRRSCVPDEPLLLRGNATDPVRELLTAVPLSASRRTTKDIIPVTFLWDRPSGEADAVIEITDVPGSFAPHDRRYGTRRLWRTTEVLPAELWAEPGGSRLIDYALEECA